MRINGKIIVTWKDIKEMIAAKIYDTVSDIDEDVVEDGNYEIIVGKDGKSVEIALTLDQNYDDEDEEEKPAKRRRNY